MTERQRSREESDDFPPRAEISQSRGIGRSLSETKKHDEVTTIVLLSLTNFLYGVGISLYGPLFPLQAEAKGAKPGIYGLILCSSYLFSILFYFVAHLMMSSVSLKLLYSIGIFTTGICKILFGTMTLIPSGIWFTSLTFAIQIVDGVAVAILMTSSHSLLFSRFQKNAPKMNALSQYFLLLGLVIGPIAGSAIYTAVGFGVSFYGIGALTAIAAICTFGLIPEPERNATSIFSWMKSLRMMIYFFLIFSSFNYTGFLWVNLESHLRKFEMHFVFVGMMFAVPAFTFGLTAPGWKWLMKKGHLNSLLLSCLSSLIIIGSLIMLGPAPFINLELTIGYAIASLVLKGLGVAGKMICVMSAAKRDIDTKDHGNNGLDLITLPTLYTMGAFSGMFTGSAMAGFTRDYIGFSKATLVLYGLEALAAFVSFILAFNRNYKSVHHASVESEHLLDS